MERVSLSRNKRAQTKCLRSQSVEKIQFYTKQQPRGSAHEIEIVQRFLCFRREMISAWELSDDLCSA